MFDRIALVLRWLRALCRLRGDLALENLALRQQLTVLSRRHSRPPLSSVDRFFWVMLAASLGRVDRRAHHRQTRHRDRMASGGVSTVLAISLEGKETGWTAPYG